MDKNDIIGRMNMHIVFRNVWVINSFGGDIYNGTIILKQTDQYQNDLLVEILNFRKQLNQTSPEEKQKKEDVLEN